MPLHGALKSARPEENLDLVEKFLSPFEILPFAKEAAEHYVNIRHQLAIEGSLISPNDLIIAATTRAAEATLITNNTSEFSRVPDIDLSDWTT